MQMVVDRDAKELAVVNRCGAAVDGAEERDALRARIDVNRRPPDLPARFDVDRETPLAVHDVHDAVVDRGRTEFARIVHEAGTPDRHEALDVGPVDLRERAVTLAVVAHALRGDVVGVAAVVDEVVGALGPGWGDGDDDHCRSEPRACHVHDALGVGPRIASASRFADEIDRGLRIRPARAALRRRPLPRRGHVADVATLQHLIALGTVIRDVDRVPACGMHQYAL